MDTEAGLRAYHEGHIPGARYAHLDDDLAARRGPATGRHPLPDAADFAARLADWGITPATRVIAYDAAGGALAARLWWLLRWAGHQRVALLDGGLPAWTAAGLPLETGAVTPGTTVTTPYPVRPGSMPTVTTAELQRRLAAGVTLLDARDSQRFAGVTEPIDARAGHVPGARNWPFSNNLDADGRFLPVDELQGRLASWLGAPGHNGIVSMCGSGVTACHTLFALEYAGLTAAMPAYPALYVGSWSEWIADPDRPVAVGTAAN
jgi:thiosulfate/3-mercaptopyruvate sulfurtransferase